MPHLPTESVSGITSVLPQKIPAGKSLNYDGSETQENNKGYSI